ncbi:MAG: hypothetical protein JSR46_06750, partial [Verrucomicrobia bacterium]|nr:hypothetical protein [Verrucomicrobiota bacterium]
MKTSRSIYSPSPCEVFIPDDVQAMWLQNAIKKDTTQVAKLTLVCTKWRDMIDDQSKNNPIWKCLLDHQIETLTYDIPLPLEGTLKEKVKFLINTKNEDFQILLDSFNVQRSCDFTELFKELIREKKYEQLALFLLFKPTFNTHIIAKSLLSDITAELLGNQKASLCLEMLIKRKSSKSYGIACCAALHAA